jgi:glutathione S-transferase
MIKLYGVTASRASRSLWALEEVGVNYEQVPVHFLADTKKPEYLAINPNGRIPALVDGDFKLFESMAINLYLAKKYDGGAGPLRLRERAALDG